VSPSAQGTGVLPAEEVRAPAQPVEPRLRASRDGVQVWILALPPLSDPLGLPSLSASERRFAERLGDNGADWMTARILLRRILACYLGMAPGEVEFASGAHGKPRLAAGGAEDVRFSLSRSGPMAVLAFRLGHEVGVDVERLRPGIDWNSISRHVIELPEAASLAEGISETRDAACFRAWVRAEALAKATGLGLTSPPAPRDGARMWVRDLDGIPGHAAAIASEGSDWRLDLREGFPARGRA
jgi:4'-phosphopantetheinyl transferase